MDGSLELLLTWPLDVSITAIPFLVAVAVLSEMAGNGKDYPYNLGI